MLGVCLIHHLEILIHWLQLIFIIITINRFRIFWFIFNKGYETFQIHFIFFYKWNTHCFLTVMQVSKIALIAQRKVTPYCKILFLSQQRFKNNFILNPNLLFYLNYPFPCSDVDFYFKLVTVCEFCPSFYLQW